MKKFISALTSVAIAATAMGSVLSMSASAAVDSTIFDIRTGDSNAITVSAADIAAGDVTVPVSIYIPQCEGVNTVAIKLAVNGDETLGQAPATHKYLFGNYGITLQAAAEGGNTRAEGYAKTACLDAEKKGNVAYQSPIFIPEYFNFSYMNQNNIMEEKNCTNYSAKLATEASDVTSWSESESWAYDHPLFVFDMVLPKGLADGTYTLDIYTKDYVNATSLNDPEPTYTASYIAGVDGTVNLVSRPLVVTVGEGGSNTTPSSSSSTTTTTTTSTSTTPPSSDAMQIIGDKKTAKPGDTVRAGFIVKNDPGTAGMQLFFDTAPFDSVEMVDLEDEDPAYFISPTWNPAVGSFVWGGANNEEVEEGGYLAVFELKVPADASGTLKLDLNKNEKNAVRNRDMQDNKFSLSPIEITVEGGSTSSSTSTSTTSDPIDTNAMQIIGDKKTAKPGDVVRAGFIVKNDPGTAGMQLFFDTAAFAKVEMVDLEDEDPAYFISPTWNGKVGSFVWGGANNEEVEEGGYLVVFELTVPDDATGTLKLDLNKAEKNAIRNRDMEDNKFSLSPIEITVASDDTTTSSTTTSSTTSSTTTSSTTSSTTTSTTTSSAPESKVVWGDVNCDSKVSIADVVLLNKHNAQNANVTAQGLLNADCVNDEKLDSADATAIKGHLAKFYGTDAFPFASLADCTAKMK